MKYIYALSLLLLLSLSPVSHAVSVFGGGVTPFVQAPDTEKSIYGMRINLGWGVHKEVYGIDFGVAGNTTTHSFAGLQAAGGFNWNHGKTLITGLQMAAGLNFNNGKSRIIGAQVAALGNINKGDAYIVGAQLSAIGNWGRNHIRGVQVGVYNRARTVKGIQVGIINVADNLKGIQIGLANYNKSGPIPFFPGINIGF